MRNPKGTVVVCVDKGMLRLQLPRFLFGGQQKYLYLGLPDTPTNRMAAYQKAQAISADIAFERFDFSLAKYQPQYQQQAVEFTLALDQLWTRYTDYKRGHLAITTINKDFKRVATHIGALPSKSLHDARKIRRHLTERLGAATAKKILMQINACCQWAADEELVPRNPFANLPAVKARKPQPKINPFNRQERDTLIVAFESDCPYYAPFVKFLFWTGCRPSEAIGLQWKHVTPDLSEITFSEAVVEGNRKDTKTHTIRKFPCNAKLRELLASIKPAQPDLNALVFSSPKGFSVDQHNFLNREWKEQLEKNVIAYRVPYNCRHTFITLCLDAGVPVTQVAAWVGNSTQTIWKHYAGLVSTREVPE